MNMASSECAERTAAPEIDSESLYHMQMVNQVSLAANSQQNTVMEQVIKECIQ
ncbi:hypothetical protein BGZ96_005632, partial [Linnemannia gamsii]